MAVKKLPKLSVLQSKYIQEPYDAIVDIYQKKHFDEKIFDPLIDKFFSILGSGKLVLDAGCGPGGETKKLLKKGLNVKSIDISKEMLKMAKKKVPDGNFKKMDILNLRFPPNYFDGIWSARSLIHIPNSQLSRALNNFYKTLKPNGILCIVVLKGKGEEIEPEEYDKTKKTKTFFKYFEEGELEKKLARAGFKILKLETKYRGKEKEPHLVVFAKRD